MGRRIFSPLKILLITFNRFSGIYQSIQNLSRCSGTFQTPCIIIQTTYSTIIICNNHSPNLKLFNNVFCGALILKFSTFAVSSKLNNFLTVIFVPIVCLMCEDGQFEVHQYATFLQTDTYISITNSIG